MAAFFLALARILLWVLIVIVALLLLLLLLPAGARLQWSQKKLQVWLVIFGISIPISWLLALIPKQPKKKKAKKEKLPKKEKQSSTPQNVNPAKKLSDLLQKISGMCKHISWLAQKILGALHIRHIRLYLPICADTAAATAQQYGEGWAAISATVTAVQKVLDLQFDQLKLEADYAGLHAGEEHFSCKITGQLIIMVAAGLYTVWKLKEERLI